MRWKQKSIPKLDVLIQFIADKAIYLFDSTICYLNGFSVEKNDLFWTRLKSSLIFKIGLDFKDISYVIFLLLINCWQVVLIKQCDLVNGIRMIKIIN